MNARTQEFLKKEYSAENIYFWTACKRYKCLPPGPERTKEAKRIYQQHLCSGAPEPVNVDSQARQSIHHDEASSNLFDQAEKQIFNLMKFDSYSRFLKSNLYQQCVLNVAAASSKQPFKLDNELLLLQPAVAATAMVVSPANKLKKSLSNAEDRRRNNNNKSVLPWHRKNRSKSKDRGEFEYDQRCTTTSNENINSQDDRKITSNNDVYSSRSSLTSLDLAIISSSSTQVSFVFQ